LPTGRHPGINLLDIDQSFAVVCAGEHWGRTGLGCGGEFGESALSGLDLRRAPVKDENRTFLMASNDEDAMFMEIIEGSSLAHPGAIVPRRRGNIRQVVTRPGSAVICESPDALKYSHSRASEFTPQAFGNPLLTDWIPRLRGNAHGSRMWSSSPK
jgi:hypothetical protein